MTVGKKRENKTNDDVQEEVHLCPQTYSVLNDDRYSKEHVNLRTFTHNLSSISSHIASCISHSFFIFVSNTVSHTLSNVNVDTNINQSLSIHFLSVATEHPLHKNKQTQSALLCNRLFKYIKHNTLNTSSSRPTKNIQQDYLK